MLAVLNTEASANEKYSSAEYLKNYALSVCIAKGYSAKEVKNDAAAAARVIWSSAIILWRRIPPSGRWQRISGKAL